MEGRKVFVGGVSYQTTEASLRAHFEKYGEIVDCFVMRDKATGKPRGFAFCCFRDPEVAHLVVTETHVIDGRQVEVKVAIPKDQTACTAKATPGRHPALGKYRKIFVGGLSPSTTDEMFRAYFGQFGHMEDSVVMFDPATNRPRGFGFVTYGDDASVERVFEVGNVHELDAKKVEVKRAVPKDASAPPPRVGGPHSGALRIWPQFAGAVHGPGRGNGISVGLVPGLAIQHMGMTGQGRGRSAGYGYLAGFRGDLGPSGQVNFGNAGGQGWGSGGPLWAGANQEITFVPGGIFPPGAVEQLVAMQQAAMGQGDFNGMQQYVVQPGFRGGQMGQMGQMAHMGQMGQMGQGFDGGPAGFLDDQHGGGQQNRFGGGGGGSGSWAGGSSQPGPGGRGGLRE